MRAAINKANTLRALVTFGFIRNITSMSSSSSQSFVSRSVIKKIFAKLQKEGDGAVVRRGISRFINLSISEISMIINVLYLLRFLLLNKLRSEQKLLDPFLMLDEFSGKFLEAAILFIYLVYTLNNGSHLLITL